MSSPLPTASAPDDDLLQIFHDRPYSRFSLPAPFTVGSTSTPLHIPTLQPCILPEQKKKVLAIREGESANVVSEVQAHLREDPYEFLRQLGHWATGTSWRGFNSYVGQRIFYETYSEEQISFLLKSEAVNRRIDTLVEQRGGGKEERRKLKREAEMMMRGVVPTMDSVPSLRAFGATVNNILVRLYDQGIHISPTEFLAFRKAAIKAQDARQSLLVVPCHKSHIDYLTISFLFFRLSLALPHIVAGDNLNLPVVGKVLKNCGAMFIRRSFGEDTLYSTIVQEYVELLLEQGHNIECFIEGTRSRTGKLLPPKLGILKYVLDALVKGRASDVWIAPISVQYDKIIETESYVNELLGNPKEKESLWGLVTNTRILQLKNGRIDVRFNEPFSLRLFVEDQLRRRSSEPDSPDRIDVSELMRED
ncbi:acyltransferase-domain-containing protein, partial [Atractiella rhizophila]